MCLHVCMCKCLSLCRGQVNTCDCVGAFVYIYQLCAVACVLDLAFVVAVVLECVYICQCMRLFSISQHCVVLCV